MKRVALLTVGLSLLTACAPGTAPGNGRALTGRCAGTAQFSFICDAEKPEDLAHIPGTPWIVASGFAKGAGLKIIHSRTRVAHLWSTGRSDQIERRPINSDCASPPDPALFTARGLNLRVVAPGKARLLVVNHGGREAIEMFAVDFTVANAMPTLRWQGCVLMPPGQVGNSVASYSDGTILVTVLTRAGTTITDFVSGRATGDVWERKAGERALRVLPGTQLPGNNGIETARDDSGFYVVAFSLREIVAYARSDTRQPLWRAQAPNFMPDNIHWDGDRLLLAGMVRDEPACGGVRQIVNGVADAMACHRGYIVAQLYPDTQRFSVIAQGPRDPVFNGVSAAIIVDSDMWLGSYQADRIAIKTFCRDAKTPC